MLKGTSVSIDESVLTELDSVAATWSASRSVVIEVCCRIALKEREHLDDVMSGVSDRGSVT